MGLDFVFLKVFICFPHSFLFYYLYLQYQINENKWIGEEFSWMVYFYSIIQPVFSCFILFSTLKFY